MDQYAWFPEYVWIYTNLIDHVSGEELKYAR